MSRSNHEGSDSGDKPFRMPPPEGAPPQIPPRTESDQDFPGPNSGDPYSPWFSAISKAQEAHTQGEIDEAEFKRRVDAATALFEIIHTRVTGPYSYSETPGPNDEQYPETD